MNSKIRKVIIWSALALTLFIALGWLCNTWFYCDDFDYRHVIRRGYYCATLPLTSSLSELPESWYSHWCLSNARWPNMVIIFIEFLNRQIGCVIAALSLLFMVIMQARLAQTDRKLSIATAFASIFLTWTAYPWYDNFQSIAYHFNYTVVTVFALIVIGEIIGNKQSERPKIWLLICALLTGNGHEAIAIPTLIFGAVYWIAQPSRRRFLTWILLAILVGSALLICPGIFLRVERIKTNVGPTLDSYLTSLRLILELWPLWLSIAFTVITLIFKRERITKADKLFVTASFMSLLSSLIIASCVQGIGRILWGVQLMSVLIIIKLLAKYHFPKGGEKIKTVLASIAIIAYAFWGYTLDVTQHRLAQEQQCVFHQLEQTDWGPVYCDLTLKKDIPYWLKDITNTPFEPNYHLTTMSQFYLGFNASKSRRWDFMVLPTRFKNLQFDQWPKWPGNNPFRGEGYFFGSTKSYEGQMVDVTLAPPGDNIAPYIKLMCLIKNHTLSEPTRHQMTLSARDTITNERDTIFIHTLTITPRTDQCRHILRIDLH